MYVNNVIIVVTDVVAERQSAIASYPPTFHFSWLSGKLSYKSTKSEAKIAPNGEIWGQHYHFEHK